MKKRVLITGGAGFIAHHTIQHIINNTDWEIVSLDRLDYSGNLNRISDMMQDMSDKNKKRLRVVHHDLRAEINDMLSAIDNAGVGLTGSKERQLRSKLDIMFTNPSTLNSAIYDGKIQGVTLDIPEEILNGDPAVLKETVINQIIDSSRTNAAEEQTRRKNSFSGGAGQYYGPQDTGKKDGDGNKIYFRMPKDPNGKIIYTTLDPPGINKETPVETPAETPVSTPSSYDRDGDGIPDSFDVDGGDGTGTPGAFGPRNDPNAKTNTNTATSKKPAGYDQLVNMIKDSAKTKSNPATEEEIKEALTKGPEAMKALIAKYKKK